MLKTISLRKAVALQLGKLKIGVYGASGVGKTKLIQSLSGKIGIATTEDGLLSLHDAPDEVLDNSDVWVVKTVDDLNNVYEHVCKGGYDWLVTDSVTELAEICLVDLKETAANAWDAYGELAEQFIMLIRSMKELDCNSLFIFQETSVSKKINKNLEIEYFSPEMAGKKLPKKTPFQFDEIWRLAVVDNERVLITQNDGYSVAKSRLGLPQIVDASNGISELLEQIKQRQQEIAEKQTTKKEDAR
jgi:energy-coupling factor transporter ATP-binding protein EcfA2